MRLATAVFALVALVCFVSPSAAQEQDPVAARIDQWMQRLVPTSSAIEPNTHECAFHTNLSCNTTVADTVNIFGCRTDNFGYFNMHRFFIDANTKITLSMQSFSFSSLLILTNDAATAVLASANAPSGGTATASYTTLSAGYYLALAGPVADLATGNYALSMTCTKVSTGACTPSSTTMCLNNDRFAVSATWRTTNGNSGNGQAVRLSSDTGYFTFFSASNVEVVIKVLNACGLNSKYWVFAGGLTDVAVTLTVRDTKSGTVKTYNNPLGLAFQPIQDTSALGVCP
ncbi:MAG: hypothetical protein AABO58_20730 [Acidobacteriota bacterium]